MENAKIGRENGSDDKIMRKTNSEDDSTEQNVAEKNKTKSQPLPTWKDLGLADPLCTSCEKLKWKEPSKIQCEAIPHALQGKDIIGLAETGSGKTAAFVLPILQALLQTPQSFFALILTPTRELASQISEQIEALAYGSAMSVKSAVIVGGVDMVPQSYVLATKPHIIIATPGRLSDHLEKTKGFSLKTLKYLVMDEADRMLNMDFEIEVNKILKAIPKERKTYLYSATMTKKVTKLQRTCLRDPVKVEVCTKYQTVEQLEQYYIFQPDKFKDIYLAYIMNELAGNSFIIFCTTCYMTLKTAILLRNLGFTAIPLHGKMSQSKRNTALDKFKAKSRSILVSTDVASRGLDIPHVDVVINFDMPTPKNYIHRVGRTARAGRAGKAILFVTEYEAADYKDIQDSIGKELLLYKTEEAEVMALQERVEEAQRIAKKEVRQFSEKSKRKKKQNDDEEDDTENAVGLRKRLKGGDKKQHKNR